MNIMEETAKRRWEKIERLSGKISYILECVIGMSRKYPPESVGESYYVGELADMGSHSDTNEAYNLMKEIDACKALSREISKRKVTGYSFFDEPVHKHDCNTCKYLFTIGIHVTEQNARLKYPNSPVRLFVDVYQNCDNHTMEAPYLIRYSSEGSDYATTSIRNLVGSYVVDHLGLNL